MEKYVAAHYTLDKHTKMQIQAKQVKVNYHTDINYYTPIVNKIAFK